MRRFLTASILAAALASACKVERTPERYFDHTERVESEREAAAEAELRARVLALGRAIARGSAREAMIALAPAPDIRIVTPDPEIVLTGADAVGAALAALVTTPMAVEMRDVAVTVGPLGNVAWFETHVDAPGAAPGGTMVRVTGVYLRTEGAWRLVQAHVSTPANSPNPAPRDSAESHPEA